MRTSVKGIFCKITRSQMIHPISSFPVILCTVHISICGTVDYHVNIVVTKESINSVGRSNVQLLDIREEEFVSRTLCQKVQMRP